MRFAKYHGLGNDFVLLAAPDVPAGFDGAWAARLCERHLGIGADGVLIVTRPADTGQAPPHGPGQADPHGSPPGAAGARASTPGQSSGQVGPLAAPPPWLEPVPDGCAGRMTLYNADGSLAEMCGNGIRCVALHLHRLSLAEGAHQDGALCIATGAGPRVYRLLDAQAAPGDDSRLRQAAPRPAPVAGPAPDSAAACPPPERSAGEPAAPTRALVQVEMGQPSFSHPDLPGAGRDGTVPLTLAGGLTVPVYPASVGNPHAVVLATPRLLAAAGEAHPAKPALSGHQAAAAAADERRHSLRRLAAHLGPLVEHHPAFPRRTNVEFVAPAGPGRYEVVVWERGVGLTLACGTGATAVAAVARYRWGGAPVAGANAAEHAGGSHGGSAFPVDQAGGRAARPLVDRADGLGSEITVVLPGGPLRFTFEPDGAARMTGPAEYVYQGEWPW